MAQSPYNLPEQTWQGKRKNDMPAPESWMKRGCGCLLPILLLVLGLLLGGVAIFALVAPQGFDFFGIQVTAAMLKQTEWVVGETSDANAQHMLDNQRTQAALDNQANLLNQTATQGVLDRYATQTALSVSNVQQQTQAAINYQATQSSLNQIGTQVELDFAATRSAINQNATGVSNSAPAINATPAPQILLDERFIGISAGSWLFQTDGWTSSGDSITATATTWLLSYRADFANYRLDVWATPSNTNAVYEVLLMRAGNNNHILVRYTTHGAQLADVSVDRWTNSAINASNPLYTTPPERIDGRAGDITLRDYQFSVEVHGVDLRILADNTEILRLALDTPIVGQVGAQFSPGAQLKQIRVTTLANP